MKKINFIIFSILTILGFGTLALALPTASYHNNLLPFLNNTYDLGSTTPNLQWKNLFTVGLTVSGTPTFSGLGTNMLVATNGSGSLVASSTPTASHYLATSTTATSTLSGNLFVGGNAQVNGSLYAPVTFTDSGNATVGGTVTASNFVGTSTANNTFAGNVGIGTTTVAKKFVVAEDSAYPYMRVVRSDVNQYTDFWAGGITTTYNGDWNISQTHPTGQRSIIFQTTPASGSVTDRMTITGLGNVGIGTTTPGSKLAINQSSTGMGLYLAGYSNNTSNIFTVSTSTATATSTAFTINSNGDARPYGRLLIPMGEINYFSTTGTLVAIAAQSNGSTNLVKVAPTTTLTNDLEFDNGGANDGRLRYTGTATKTFHIAFTISMDGEGSGTNLYVFGIAKNGTVGSCKVIQSIAVANDTESTALNCMVTLATNDYLELYTGNLTDTDDITAKTLNIFAMGM